MRAIRNISKTIMHFTSLPARDPQNLQNEISIVDSIRQRGIRLVTYEMFTNGRTMSNLAATCSIEYMDDYVFSINNDFECLFSLHGPASAQNLQSFLRNDMLYDIVAKYVDVKCYFRKFAATDIKNALMRIYIAKTKTIDAAATASTNAAAAAVAATTTTPYKKKSISHVLKRRVWAEHIGEHVGKTKCLCCKLTDITQLSFHCGHIIAEKNGGTTTVDNMLPICQSCNSSMGTNNLYAFMTMHGL